MKNYRLILLKILLQVWFCLPVSFFSYATDINQFVCGTNKDGRLELFTTGNDGVVYNIWQALPNGGWSNWSTLTGHDIRQIEVDRNADGRLELFTIGADAVIYHIFQTVANSTWGNWSTLGGHDIKQIKINTNADGRLEVFAIGGDGILYHIWQLTANGSWGSWSSLSGNNLKQIEVNKNADGRLEVFAIGGDAVVYHIWQLAPNGDWGSWSPLGGHDIRQVKVSNNQDGRLEVFVLGGDAAVYHIWQSIPNGGWGSWSSLAGSNLKQIEVNKNADGRLEVFALGGDAAVYHIWQSSPNGGWGGWSTLGGHDIRQIKVSNNLDGRLEVFALGADAALFHNWQLAPNGGWGNWAGLGKPQLSVLWFAKAPKAALSTSVNIPPPNFVSNGVSHPDFFDFVSCYLPNANTEVWQIYKPNVTQPEVSYPFIKFKKGDLINIIAGGCVQRGGAGFTTQRYVSPQGLTGNDNSHFGSVSIPGVITQQRLKTIVQNGPILVTSDPGIGAILKLQYKDDGYSDNGYWGLDWGNWEQSRGMEEAWVIIIIQHNCNGASCLRAKPMDLINSRFDNNELPMNPKWAWQILAGTRPPNSQIFNFSNKSVGMPEDNVSLGTSQPTHKNNNPTKCPQQSPGGPFYTPGRIGGHINWRPAVYHGNIYWEEHSSPALDDDYSFQLMIDDQSGYTLNNAKGIGIEFNSDEVVDKAKSKWWKYFKSTVDNADKGTALGLSPDSYPTIINGKEAIVIGMVGLDYAHTGFTELHPAFLLAIHIKTDPDDDVWAIFVRNKGDNGYCGPTKEPLNLAGNKITLNLPAPPNGPWIMSDIPFGPGLSEIQKSHSGMGFSFLKNTINSASLNFTLRPPNDESLIEGEVHIRWIKQ